MTLMNKKKRYIVHVVLVVMLALVVSQCRIIKSFTIVPQRICSNNIVRQSTICDAMKPYSGRVIYNDKSSKAVTRIYTTSEIVSTDNNELIQQQQQQQQLVLDILNRIRQVNSVPTDIRESLLEFRVDGIALGQVRPKIADLLCSFNILDRRTNNNCTTESSLQHQPAFIIQSENEDGTGKAFLTLSDYCGTTFDSRSESIASITEQMKDQGYITGWRDELFPVTTSFYSTPVFSMERAAVSFLGVPEYGVHIIGLVQQDPILNSNDDDGIKNTLQMWMARRSPTKSKWPNMMDHIAAGGQPIGLSLIDNVVKECQEEAGIPESITRNGLRPAGAVTYENYVPRKDVVERIVLFCFDLYLPKNFQPKPVDGEVEAFYLYNIETDVMNMMSPNYHDPMKPNCYLVVIDFLIRHGYISPDIPGYLDIVRELRTGVCQ